MAAQPDRRTTIAITTPKNRKPTRRKTCSNQHPGLPLRLGLNIRLLADERDRRYLTDLVHKVAITLLAATFGVIAVQMLGLHGGPNVTHRVTLYAFLGYSLLVVAGMLARRVLMIVFRLDAG